MRLRALLPQHRHKTLPLLQPRQPGSQIWRRRCAARSGLGRQWSSQRRKSAAVAPRDLGLDLQVQRRVQRRKRRRSPGLRGLALPHPLLQMRKLRKRPAWNDLVRAQMLTRRKKKKERPEQQDLEINLVDQLGKMAKTAPSRMQPLLQAQPDLVTPPLMRSQILSQGDFW